MPKAATRATNPMVPPHRVARRSRDPVRASPQPARALPGNPGDDLDLLFEPAAVAGGESARGPRQPAGARPGNKARDFDVVHAHCKQMLEHAEAVNRELTDQYNRRRRQHAAQEQQRAAEKDQLAQQAQQAQQHCLEIQRQRDEIRYLKTEVTRLEELVATVTSNARGLVSRDEMRKALDEIHANATVFMNKLTVTMGTNENVYGFSELPELGAIEASWQHEDTFSDVLQDPGIAGLPESMFPAPDPEPAADTAF